MKGIHFAILLLFISRFAYGQDGNREVLICEGTPVRLKAESLGATSFEWRKDNQLLVGFYGSELVVSEEGNYSACALNGDGCPSDQSVIITVILRKPTAVEDFATGSNDQPIIVDVLKNDIDVCGSFDPNSLQVSAAPTHGAVEASDGKFIYTADATKPEADSFSYSVKDSDGQESDMAMVTLKMTTPGLPVTLISFEAVRDELSTRLSWITSEEKNSESFDVERSANAKNWEKIGAVKAGGNSASQNEYKYMDDQPLEGRNYYRLKMIDLDGTFTYSYIRTVQFPELSWAQLYPNPVNHTLNIKIRNSKVRKIRLIDSMGKVVLAASVSNSLMTVDMRGNLPGIYFAYLEQENGLVAIFKISHY